MLYRPEHRRRFSLFGRVDGHLRRLTPWLALVTLALGWLWPRPAQACDDYETRSMNLLGKTKGRLVYLYKRWHWDVRCRPASISHSVRAELRFSTFSGKWTKKKIPLFSRRRGRKMDSDKLNKRIKRLALARVKKLRSFTRVKATQTVVCKSHRCGTSATLHTKGNKPHLLVHLGGGVNIRSKAGPKWTLSSLTGYRLAGRKVIILSVNMDDGSVVKSLWSYVLVNVKAGGNKTVGKQAVGKQGTSKRK